MAEYLIQSETLTAIADKERIYLGNIGKISPANMATYVDSVYNAGVAQGGANSVSWDVIQNNGKRTDYECAFYCWNMEYIRPKHKVSPTAGGYIFYGNNALKKVEAKYFDFSRLSAQTSTFQGCTSLEEVEDIGIWSETNYSYTFSGCSKLHTIAKMTVGENTLYTVAFMNCSALENLTINGTIGRNGLSLKWSTKLSKASIMSVISHLSTTTTGFSITLSKTAVDNAFRFAPSGLDGSETSEWATVVASRSNWTINLA